MTHHPMPTDRPAFAAYLKAMQEHKLKICRVAEWEREFNLGIRSDHPDALSARHYATTQRDKGFADADAALRDAFDAAVKESIQANKTNLDAMLGL